MPILIFVFPHRMEPRLLEILGKTSICEISKVGFIHNFLVNSYSLGWGGVIVRKFQNVQPHSPV